MYSPLKKMTMMALVCLVSTSLLASTFTFTGKGSWQDRENWEKGNMPAMKLEKGDKVIINGKCLYNLTETFTITEGSVLEITEGNTLYISMGKTFNFTGGAINNLGTIQVISGTLVLPENITVSGRDNINASDLASISATPQYSIDKPRGNNVSANGGEPVKITLSAPEGLTPGQEGTADKADVYTEKAMPKTIQVKDGKVIAEKRDVSVEAVKPNTKLQITKTSKN